MIYPDDLSFGPDSRLILIGTTVSEDDPDMLPPLPHARANVDHLARLFTDPDICGLDPSCIVPLVDIKTAGEVLHSIWTASHDATDTLLVYYAGHGLYGDSQIPIYLAATKTTDRGKAYNGISINLVKQAMNESRARKRILILDCCYSGRAIEGGMNAANDAATVLPAIDLVGTFGIAAVPANAKALAPPGQTLTAFTSALIEVMEEGLPIDDPVLRIEKVFDEVERKIGRDARAPLPKSSNFDKGEKFLFVRNRKVSKSDLNELSKVVHGLRQTVASTNRQLEDLKASIPSLHVVNKRLAAVEAEIDKLKNSEDKSKSEEIFDRVKLTKEQWDKLSISDKVHVQRFYSSRALSAIWIIVALYASLAIIIWTYVLPPSGDALACAVTLFFVGFVTAALAVTQDSKQEPRTELDPGQSSDPDYPQRNNETLITVLNQHTIDLLGFRLLTRYVKLAGIFTTFGSMASIFRLLLK